VSLDWFVRQVKLVLLTYAYASLVAAAFVPSWATQYPYGEGWIPGLSFRLHGATAHANTLGPLMALYLILTSHAPTRMRGENMHRAVAIGLLILSQSKSTWGALLVAGAVHRGLEVWASRHRLQAPQGRRSIAGHGLTLVVFAILASVALPLVQPWPAVSRSVSYLQSYYPVVGRMLLWDVTIQLWRENPWFGYGPTLWGPSMSSQLLSVLRWAPGSAHNQLFQTLGESGLVGVICLFVYLTALVVAGLRRAAGSPLPLTLVVLLSVRGAAEAVFRGGPDSLSFFMHFVAYGILLASDNKCVDHSLATPSGGGRL
jgi:O-antigen ligase